MGNPPFFDQISEFNNVDPILQWAIFIVGALIIVVGVISAIIAIWLAIRYVRFNHTNNSKNLTGENAARQVLDKNGLHHIKVSVWGSVIFGNSYSHYFHKVRLRRLTLHKSSITSLAMGVEKSALAIMDKEGDKDMKTRVILTPFMYFGPFMFVPLILIGVVVDLIFFNFTGVTTVISAAVSILLYVISFVLSVMTLKTEVKAQNRAIEIMKSENMANEQEIEMIKELFKLYNIQYVNDLILEVLQMIMKILQIVAKMQASSSSSN